MSPATAFATIAQGAAAMINAGDQVIVGPGVYQEGNVSPPRSGVPGRPMVFRGDPTGVLTGDPAGPVLLAPPQPVPPGLAGFRLMGARHVVVEGFSLDGFTDSAIQVRRGVGEGQNSSFVTVRDNTVRHCRRSGIEVVAVGPVEITGNTVLHSLASGITVQGCLTGSPLCDPNTTGEILPTVSNNTVGVSGNDLGGHGMIFFEARDGVVQNNVTFSNRATGLTLRQTEDMLIFNNLSYANDEDGFAFGTADRPAERTQFVNNTAYRNGGWGMSVGTQAPGSSGAISLNNILQENSKGGVTVSREASCGWVSGFNVNPDGAPVITRQNDYDIAAAALFVDPAGRDGILAGEGYADDDFRLRQRHGGQSVDSPGVDAGSGLAADLGITGSTRTGGVRDTRVVDAGFHYGASPTQRIQVENPFMPVFVRKGGSDALDGLAPDRALATIGAAAGKARAGVTVVVGPGVYPEGNLSVPQRAGRVALVGDREGRWTGDVPGPVVVDVEGRDTGFVLLDACEVGIRGFHVTRAFTAAIQVRAGSDGARVEDNVVFGNERRGIQVMEVDRVAVANNLSYANGTGGIHVTTSAGSTMRNNTVYGNGEVGILVDGASSATTVARNVTQGNFRGVLVNSDSAAGYVTGFNLVAEGFTGNTPRADSDVVAPARFVLPAGLDGVLGGAGFEDDDFRLRQDAGSWSPAVDIDYDALPDRAWGTTRGDDLPDLGPPDGGVHYPAMAWSLLDRPVPHIVYVRQGGSDSADGSSPFSAYASLGKALDSISGDAVVVVGPGRYTSKRLFIGARGAVTAIVGDPAGVLTGDPPGLVLLDGAGGAPRVTGPAVLRNLVFAGSPGPGLRVDRAAGEVEVRDVVVCGNRRAGVVSATDGLSLVNSLVTGNGGPGVSIRLRNATRGARVFNTTVAANLGHGMVLRESGGGPAAHLMAVNNVVAGNGRIGMLARAVRAPAADRRHNLNSDGYGPRLEPAPGDIDADPRFTHGMPVAGIGCESLYDFTLRSDSPAIDAGLGSAVALRLGNRSATAGGAPDTGAVDLGFHYGELVLAVPTRTATPKGSPTATPTRTAALTRTPTITRTPTGSPTATSTASVTRTSSPTSTHSPSATPSPTQTLAATPLDTATPPPTATPTPTHTAPATHTETAAPTATATPTATPSETTTAIPSETTTAIPTETEVPTATPTETATETPTATPTETETPTAIPSETEVSTATPTETATAVPPTATATPTESEEPSVTPTATPT